MKIWITSIALFICSSLALMAQGEHVEFSVTAPDTVAVGEAFEISFISKNAKGEFVEPNWGSLGQVRSSKSSSSMSIINGVATSEYSWTYTVIIDEEGIFTINPASLVQKELTLKTDWEKIVAVEGYIMPKRVESPNPFSRDIWGRKAPEKEKAVPKTKAPKKKKKFKRKKKTYRI